MPSPPKTTGYAKKRVTVNDQVWTAIMPPIDCNYFSLKNAAVGDLLLRSNPTDATTEDLLANGTVESMCNPKTDPLSGQYRFWHGVAAIYIKSVKNTGTVISTWMR